MNEPFYSFNTYLKQKFGQRVHRISLDAGFTCPNLDGTTSDQGCIYCDNQGFSAYAGRKIPLEQQIRDSIDFYRKKMGVEKFIAYFQAFSSTHADIRSLKAKYDIIREFPEIVGLCISTRPDCVDEEKIALIAEYQAQYRVWIEYGLQTTHDRLLAAINRNHTYQDFLNALALARSRNIDVGVHMILGLPGAKHSDMMEDARVLSGLDIQGVKFHVLHVLANTPLEKMYRAGNVTLMEQHEYVRTLCDFLERIPPAFTILRLVSSASQECLVAPAWINRRQETMAAVIAELEKRGTRQGSRFESEEKNS